MTKHWTLSCWGDWWRNTGHCLVQGLTTKHWTLSCSGTDDETLDIVLLRWLTPKHWTLSCSGDCQENTGGCFVETTVNETWGVVLSWYCPLRQTECSLLHVTACYKTWPCLLGQGTARNKTSFFVLLKGLSIMKQGVLPSPRDCSLRNTGHCLVKGTNDETLDIVLLRGQMTKHWTLSC